MSEFLALIPRMEDEPASIEGRLAAVFVETAEVRLDEYRLSEADKAKVVDALRLAALVKDICGMPPAR